MGAVGSWEDGGRVGRWLQQRLAGVGVRAKAMVYGNSCVVRVLLVLGYYGAVAGAADWLLCVCYCCAAKALRYRHSLSLVLYCSHERFALMPTVAFAHARALVLFGQYQIGNNYLYAACGCCLLGCCSGCCSE